MHRATRYFLFISILMTTGSLWGQANQLRAYTLEDGLPQSQVYDMVQDAKGYLWLGTQGGGLCNFDGNSFQVWKQGNGLLSNYIHALHFGNDTLYIGSKRGLSIKTKQGFVNFESPQVNQIHQRGNVLYLATNRGIYRLLHGTGLEQVFIHPELDSSIVNTIFFDGAVFWAATNNGLWKLNDLNTEATSKERLLSNNFTSVIAHKGKVFGATFNDGIYVLDPKNSTDAILIREPLRINAISIQNQNELWVATDNNGLTILDADTYVEKGNLNSSNGLAVSHIRKVMADRQSNIWIATSGGGFYKYFPNNFKHYNQNTGLMGNRVYAVHSALDGIWVSNSEAGLVRIDSSGIHHIPNAAKISEVKIKTITSDTKGNIWAGTDGGGVLFRETVLVDSIAVDSTDTLRIKRDTLVSKKVRTHILDTDMGFPSNWISDIYADKKNTIWAATYSSGIIKFLFYPGKKGLAVKKVFGKEDGIEDLFIRDLATDTADRLWYATKNGALGYLSEGKVTHLGQVLDERFSIGTLLFHNNRLFLGTAGSGIWWSDLDGTINFQKLSGAKNLGSENIYQLIFDDQGYLWAGTEQGVDKIALNKMNEIVDVFHFGRNDGFLGIETCLNAVDKDAMGNLWFGAIYGLTQYKPGNPGIKSQKPQIHFEALEVNYRAVDSINLKEWTNSDKTLQLKPEQTQLTFGYNTVDIAHPDEIQFRYKLNTTEWSPWSSENRQNLLGLAYGPHLFSVQSRNYRWEESDPIQFRFHIDRPLHRKLWFQLTMLGLVTLLLIGTTFWYIGRIKLRNREEQERLQLQNHLLSLEQKALRLQMNPHFIFNVLNGIKAMGTRKPQKMNATINSFATLLRETLYNSRKDYISLDQEIKTLRHYIEVEQLMAPKAFSFDISADTVPDAEEIHLPPMLIQPFVENAIRHGILKSNRAGELKIRFYTSKAFLHCTVQDNGPGIFQSQMEGTKTDHQSMALVVTRERLESISGKDALQIEEIRSGDKTVIGTQISLKIPLQTDY